MVQSIDDVRRRQQVAAGSGRVPPHNLRAEESVLGAMLLSRDAIAEALEVGISADDFYKPAHGHIFDAVQSLYSHGEPADPVTVADELGRAGLLDAIGGQAILISLQSATPATTNAAHYARIVEEHSLLRRLIRVGGEIAEIGYELPDDVIRAVDRAETMVFDIAQRRVTDSTVHLAKLLDQSLDRLEELFERGSAITGVATGYVDLDDLLSGLQPNALLVIGARPSMGKSAFALGLAGHIAIRERRPVLFFSLEMGGDELTQRLLCAEARVDSKRIRNGRLHDSDWPKINEAVGRLAEAPLYIDDNPNLTIMEIRAKARRLKAKQGDLALIVVDYLQLMTGRHGAESRQVEVAEISRGLKILARELEVPVIALSQLSRALEARTDKRPMLSDLRESGCLTADTRITRADTGASVSLGDLLASGERDIPVFTLNDDLHLVHGTMTHVFPSGEKEAFRLRLRSGREVKASANHPFLTIDGWQPLSELAVGGHVAVPAVLPRPVARTLWADDEVVLAAHIAGGECTIDDHALRWSGCGPAAFDGIEKALVHFGTTLHRSAGGVGIVRLSPALREWVSALGFGPGRGRRIPAPVFGLDDRELSLFLRHLWVAGGRVDVREQAVSVCFSTASRATAADVRALLLRFGVTSRRKVGRPSAARLTQQLWVDGGPSLRRFFDAIGLDDPWGDILPDALARAGRTPGGSGRLPPAIATRLETLLEAQGISERSFAAALGRLADDASPPPLTTDDLRVAARLLDDPWLAAVASPDVEWDEIVAIDSLGAEPVYDATVTGTHNFLADGIVVHNSIEQDADVVMFIYRDEVYNQQSEDIGTAEIIVSKHRNGPTGGVKLAFLDRYTRFANMAKGV